VRRLELAEHLAMGSLVVHQGVVVEVQTQTVQTLQDLVVKVV
jgi:hypothetical protein